jgi:protein phosphatase
MIEARLHKRRSDSPVAIGNVFRKCIIEQSRQLRLEGTSETGYVGMGATLVMVMVKNGRAYLANLGDSRIYRLRGGKLRQLSKDHSVISELLEQGRIEPQQAQGHDADGQITHYIGMDDKAMPYIRTFSLKPKDRLLLCTDGLTDMVDDVTIAGVLTRQSETQQACDELIRLANSAGGYDNITAVVLDYKNRLDRVEETVVKEK